MKALRRAAASRACARVAAIAASCVLAALAPSALAQAYPVRPIRLIVGQPAGGPNDIVARIVAQRFAELLGVPMVVENRPGASGTIAAELASKAPPDGYTLLVGASYNLALAALQIKDLRYQPTDFAPIGTIIRVPYGLAVNAKLPVTSIADLVAYAREHPGQLNYGTTGVTSTSHLMFRVLERDARIEMVHVPYKGAAATIQDMTSGRIDLVFNDLSLLVPQAKTGAIRLIAVASAERSPAAPDVPTVAEQGYAALAIEPWYGLVLPPGASPDIVATLRDALSRTLRTPDVRQRLEAFGYRPIETSPDELAALIRSEMTTFGALIRSVAGRGE